MGGELNTSRVVFFEVLRYDHCYRMTILVKCSIQMYGRRRAYRLIGTIEVGG
jgi:hypothetical protein